MKLLQNKIAYKLIEYNRKGVLICNKIKIIILNFIVITCIVGGLLEIILSSFSNYKLFIPEYVYHMYGVLAIMVVIVGIVIGYYENKWVQIGRLEITETNIKVETKTDCKFYEFESFKIVFLDNSYEGRSNWRFPSMVGMLSVSSGVNDIYFKRRKDETEVYQYSFFIENEERLKELKNKLRYIRKNYD
jgi:hypothetical protein